LRFDYAVGLMCVEYIPPSSKQLNTGNLAEKIHTAQTKQAKDEPITAVHVADKTANHSTTSGARTQGWTSSVV